MGAIKTAFDNIGNGIKHAFEAVGEVAVSAVKLDFGGVAKGMGHMVNSGGEMFRGAVELTPVVMAVNTMCDGAMDKALKREGQMLESVVNGVADTVGKDMDMVKNGVGGTLHGLVTGDMAEAGRSVVNTAIGAVSTVEDFTPEGLAVNAGFAALATVAAKRSGAPGAAPLPEGSAPAVPAMNVGPSTLGHVAAGRPFVPTGAVPVAKGSIPEGRVMNVGTPAVNTAAAGRPSAPLPEDVTPEGYEVNVITPVVRNTATGRPSVGRA